MPHLLRDSRLRAISDLARDLKSANDGAGVQNKRLRRVRRQTLRVGLVAQLVFFKIEIQSSQTLRLNAQHHDGLRLLESLIEIALDGDAGTGGCSCFRQQRLWSAEKHARPEARQ